MLYEVFGVIGEAPAVIPAPSAPDHRIGAESGDEARRRVDEAAASRRPLPKVAALGEAEEDIIAFYAFPGEPHPSCAPPTRSSGSATRSAGAAKGVGIFSP